LVLGVYEKFVYDFYEVSVDFVVGHAQLDVFLFFPIIEFVRCKRGCVFFAY
jgi:hypothetical protein